MEEIRNEDENTPAGGDETPAVPAAEPAAEPTAPTEEGAGDGNKESQ